LRIPNGWRGLRQQYLRHELVKATCPSAYSNHSVTNLTPAWMWTPS
jgi:hypothetical protein